MEFSLVYRYLDSCEFHFTTYDSLEAIYRFIDINKSNLSMYYICKNLEHYVNPQSWK